MIIIYGRESSAPAIAQDFIVRYFLLRPNRALSCQAYLTSVIDIGSHWTERRETAPCAPLFEILQRDGIQSHRVLARIQRRMMNRIVRLRLRSTSVLRDESIH